MDNQSKQKKVSSKLHYLSANNYTIFLYLYDNVVVKDKQNFEFGLIKIFYQNLMYKKALVNSANLCCDIQWDPNFQKQLTKSLHNFDVRQVNYGSENSQKSGQYIMFKVKGTERQLNREILTVELQSQFGVDVQKQLWKEFQVYCNTRNKQILEIEEQNIKHRKLKQTKIRELEQKNEANKRKQQELIIKLSALLRQKINKLQQFEEVYEVQSFDEKVQRMTEEREDGRFLSTYQQDNAFHDPVFQPSQQLHRYI